MLGVYVILEIVLIIILIRIGYDGFSGGMEPFDLMIQSKLLVVSVGVKEDIVTSSVRLIQLI